MEGSILGDGSTIVDSSMDRQALNRVVATEQQKIRRNNNTNNLLHKYRLNFRTLYILCVYFSCIPKCGVCA